MPTSFGILLSLLFFLIIVNILPTIIRVSAALRNILLKNELKVNLVTKTMDVGIKTNNAAIIYNMELNLLVLILNSSFLMFIHELYYDHVIIITLYHNKW